MSVCYKDNEQIINEDIQRIDSALSASNYEELLSTHRYIDAKYQACIENWGKSMWAYTEQNGFIYSYFEDADSDKMLLDNLNSMRAKLEAFKLRWNMAPDLDNKPHLNVNIHNEMNMNLTYEEAKQKIEDLPGLDKSHTKEIQGKIDELENISKENCDSKSKWEKIKPILHFALDKGADIAITLMSLVLQMKL